MRSLALIFILLSSIAAFSQTNNPKIDVSLSVISQRWMTADDLEPKKSSQVNTPELDNAVDFLGGYDDVVVVGEGDDLMVRFRLTNNEAKTIYYLVEGYDSLLTGYLLFRKKGTKQWNATSPAYGRETALTGGAYKWLPLLPGKSVEVEFSDLSTREDEHAISIFVNKQPTQKNRIEVISDVYYPMQH